MPRLRRANHEGATISCSAAEHAEVGRSIPSHLHGDSCRGPECAVRRLRTRARPQRYHQKHSLALLYYRHTPNRPRACGTKYDLPSDCAIIFAGENTQSWNACPARRGEAGHGHAKPARPHGICMKVLRGVNSHPRRRSIRKRTVD